MQVICTRNPWPPHECGGWQEDAEVCLHDGCLWAVGTFKAEVEPMTPEIAQRYGLCANVATSAQVPTDSHPPCPGDPADWCFVHAHWRPRPKRQNLSNFGKPCQTSGEPASGDSGPSGSLLGASGAESGGAFLAAGLDDD